MTPDGYVSLADLQAKAGFGGLGVDTVRSIVAGCPKQRFGLREAEDGALFIRANQGHSVKSVEAEQLLTLIASADDIPVCVHGTYKRAWPDILLSGALLPMSRTHVHFAASLPPAIEAKRRGGRASAAAAPAVVATPVCTAAAAAAAAAPAGAAAVSGLRAGCQLLVHADVRGAMERGGVRFYRSANGVILCETLPLAYVACVEDLTNGGAVIFRNGAPV